MQSRGSRVIFRLRFKSSSISDVFPLSSGVSLNSCCVISIGGSLVWVSVSVAVGVFFDSGGVLGFCFPEVFFPSRVGSIRVSVDAPSS